MMVEKMDNAKGEMRAAPSVLLTVVMMGSEMVGKKVL